MKKITAILTSILILCSVIVPITMSISAEDTTTGVALPGLYTSSNYTTASNKTTGKFTFDETADTITTTDNQNKAMLNYAKDMTTFTASVVVMGNQVTTSPNYGAAYAGISFHMQESDFVKDSFKFNTSGYSVFVSRSAKSLDKVILYVRYSTNGAEKKSLKAVEVTLSDAEKDVKNLNFRIEVVVDTTNITVSLFNHETGAQYGSTTTYPLDNTATYNTTAYYASGAFGLISNGINNFSELTVTPTSPVTGVPSTGGNSGNSGSDTPDPLAEKYNTYGTLTTDANGYTSTTESAARGILKTTVTAPVTDFSADLTLKAGTDGALKAGMVFRVGDVEAGQNSMEGYALILQKTTSGPKLYLYKYGYNNGTLAYLGRIAYIEDSSIAITEGAEYIIHANVVGDKVVAYFYNKANASKTSKVLSASLKTNTDNENKGSVSTAGTYYSEGGVGFHAASGYVDALNFTVKAPEEISSENKGGIPAQDNSKGSAVKGQVTMVSGVTGTEYTAGSLAEYAADFDNYTYYSSSTSNKFLRIDDGIISDTTGTKRAILDGVTVKGFHAAATMRISSEGTLRSGIIFRVNDIEKSAADDGVVGSNDIEGYAAILYKTPGTTDSHARVVLCIYKYGIVKGEYTYLGTVASKASEVPLTGYEKDITAAAGQELTIDVNVIGDQVTAYYYNAKDPSLKSEELVADLNDETDLETSTPSLKGVHYDSGAIGLTAQNYVTFTNFTVGEPNYPSTDVGDLSELDSYTIYGSGVTKEGEYFVANSSGTKKMIVNNLTVTDFKASVDMTIDNNGNLKAGFFLRVNEIGNGADAQTGYAIIVSRNYSTLGETNPNRIDIVIFKWGYQNGKLAYLGEVAREAYKSGATFMDGKMAGEELTFVVSVKGAAIDATLYKKGEENNKPATFSTNLKFAASKEKGEVAYYESGSVGLYLGNSVSDPLNTTKLRNFRIDDGSGIEIKATGKTGIAGLLSGVSPMTGEGMLIMIISAIFVTSTVVLFGSYYYGKRGKREKTGDRII